MQSQGGFSIYILEGQGSVHNNTELSPGVMWKAEAGSDKHVDICKKISKKSVAGAAWFLSAYSKCKRREIN